MKERLPRLALAVACGLVLVASLGVDLPSVTGGRFWSDAASYHAMAGSLAFDHDLEFGAEDLARVRAVYPGGPQGVFLKRVPAGGAGQRLVYAKSLLYPLAAAPLVRVLGVDRGLLLLNGLVLAAALWLGASLLSPGRLDWRGVTGCLVLFLGGVAPVYLLWETPEVFNLGLATFGLVAWSRDRPALAAALLGAAAYAKPTNLALALPLLLTPLLEAAGRSWPGRLAESARRATILLLVVGAGFGLNRLATGELNYQGGERKTFYDRYPGDPGTGFDEAGVWMTTDHVGPLVEGRDESKQSARVAPVRSREELRQSFLRNLPLFWVGRFAGALPYFPGVGAAVLLFLLAGARGRPGWLALAALGVSWLGYILLIPDNWYGGAGTIGNRYFLNLVPLGLLLLPRARTAWALAIAVPVTVLLLGPILASPVAHSLRPGDHATRAAFRVLPAELTMLGDLSVFTDVWRKRRPYNAPGGDPARRAAGDPPSYFLWFLDDGTYGQESSFGAEGFWLRGGAEAEVVLQALAPPGRVRVLVTAGPRGDIVTVRLGRDRHRLVLPPLKSGELVLAPARDGLGYYGTLLYPLRLGSRFGAASGRDERNLGSFARVVLE